MAGLFTTLSVGASGLRAHRMGMDVVGHNLANAQRPEYSRQRAELSANPPPYGLLPRGGLGVSVDDVRRLSDPILGRRLLVEEAAVGSLEAELHLLDEVEPILYDAGAPIASALDRLFDAFGALAAQPSSRATRVTVEAAAQELVGTFARASDAIVRAQDGADVTIAGHLDEVNGAAAQVARLNASIVTAEAGGATASDLRDERDAFIRQIAARVGAQIVDSPLGTTVLVAGKALVAGAEAGTLRLQPAAAPGAAAVIEFVDPDGAVTDVTSRMGAGAVGGLLAGRDQVLAASLQALDQLAFELVNAVNAVHAGGFGLDTVTGRNLFASLATPTGAAASLAVDPAVAGDPDAIAAAGAAADLPGGATVAIALEALRATDLALGGTATAAEGIASLTSDLGVAGALARNALDVRRQSAAALEAARLSVSGVSTDEEAVALIAHQRAFEASARIVTTVDEMLRTVLSM